MDDILSALAAPFPPDAVSWRVGSTTADKKKGLALAYLDSRDVQDRLNQVCGINWQVRHPWAVGGKLACEIGILVDGQWIWRGDGAGDTDVEAEKGAFSDSFKRAAVRFGIGRYLYDTASPWVELKPAGRSYAIADHELPRLRSLLAKGAQNAPAAPPPPPKLATATPGEKPKRDDQFFKGRSYEISPRALQTWSAWETAYRNALATAKTLAEVSRVEKDNEAHRATFCAKAHPDVVEALRKFTLEEVSRVEKVAFAA